MQSSVKIDLGLDLLPQIKKVKIKIHGTQKVRQKITKYQFLQKSTIIQFLFSNIFGKKVKIWS